MADSTLDGIMSYPYTVAADVKNINTDAACKKYSYHFGIDSVSFSNVDIDKTMCYVSDDIDIGITQDDEYLQLSSVYSEGQNGSIEFYIIDGQSEKPILPIQEKYVKNEKIFFGLQTRFSVSEDHAPVIKKNGTEVDISLNEAINSNSSYTVDYLPLEPYNIKAGSSTIKVKAILRTYDKNAEAPYIKSIAIRKYGRDNIWKQTIM